MFGAPIVVIAFGRFGEHLATRSAASEAARVALADAYAVQALLGRLLRAPPAEMADAVTGICSP